MAKFCPNCGTNYDDNMMNCPNCGAPAPQMNNDQYNQQQYNQQQYQQPMGNQQYNPQFQQQPMMPGAKSKMAAGLLGIFLGAYGVHNFYLGNAGRGVLQLILTIVTCGMAGIWGFIEGILILCGNINTDAQGRPLV